MTEAPNRLSTETANAAGIPPPANNDNAMPPKVAAAVNAVMAEVPKLEKTEKNTHGNYNFTSIDDFLEALRPLCAEHGLIIIQDEESFELKQTPKSDGKMTTWLIVKFRFTLVHTSGETWACRPARTIMVNAAMGAQAFGAAQSYALKMFMRSLFQVATGEADVDTDDNSQGRRPFDQDRADEKFAERAVNLVKRKNTFALVEQFGEIAYTTENVDDYAERLSALLDKMPNLAELEQLWENNESQVKLLPASRAGDVKALYEGRSAELAGEPERRPDDQAEMR